MLPTLLFSPKSHDLWWELVHLIGTWKTTDMEEKASVSSCSLQKQAHQYILTTRYTTYNGWRTVHWNLESHSRCSQNKEQCKYKAIQLTLPASSNLQLSKTSKMKFTFDSIHFKFWLVSLNPLEAIYISDLSSMLEQLITQVWNAWEFKIKITDFGSIA